MTRKTGLNPIVIVTGHPKAVLSLRFHLFYVWCCSIFKCFNFNTSVCPSFLVQSCHLFGKELLTACTCNFIVCGDVFCPSFPLSFGFYSISS